MSETFNTILIIFILIVVYFCIKNKNDLKPIKKNTPIPQKHNVENFVNTDKIFFNKPYELNEFAESEKETKEILFNYSVRPEDKEFLEEQENGVNLNTWYPNTYIEKLDKNGKPIWNSRSNTTGKKDTFVQEHIRKTFEFNEPKSIHMDGTIAPEAVGTKISDVFDNYFVNYKKLTPQKEMIRKDNEAVTEGASNLSFFSPDTWVYENEKPENGGMIVNGLYAVDVNNLDPVAIF